MAARAKLAFPEQRGDFKIRQPLEKQHPTSTPAVATSAPSESGLGPKPTSTTAKGSKNAIRELLSSGHPFSLDELSAATGVPNKATLATAIADLKNQKYAGAAGALQIVKRPDGSYHVQKSIDKR